MGILAWQLNARVKKLVAKNKTPTYFTHQSISSLETSTKKKRFTYKSPNGKYFITPSLPMRLVPKQWGLEP